jgi:MFS family permease
LNIPANTNALFAVPAFMRFWYARVSGTIANQMLLVAIGWQMYDLTGSAWDLGLVGLCQFLPALVLTLVVGHVLDRVNRAWVLSGCFLLQLAVSVGLAVASHQQALGREWLLGISVLLGVAKAFQMPALQALLPALLPAHLLSRGMAFGSAGMQAAIIGGPALGGVIYVAGASAVYGVSASLFALACVLCWVMGHVHVPRAKEPVSLSTLLAGVQFIAQRPVILGAISLDLFAVLLGGATALLPMFAKDILHTGPWGLGLLRSAPAVGALLMSLALTRWPITRHVGRLLFGSVVVFGLATLMFGVSKNFMLSFIALWVSGAADMVSVVIRQTLVQLETPDDMRGRVSAVNSIFIGASNQLGEFESGASAVWLGPVGSVVVGGIGTLLVAVLWMKMFPALLQRETLSL